MTEVLDKKYAQLIQTLKQEIASSRIKAHLAVNEEMISLYWRIGNLMLERQKQEGWGSKVTRNISCDLMREFPEMKGLSTRNLIYMQTFAGSYSEFTQQVAAQIPWGHNCVILDKIHENEKRIWYIHKIIENGWSRNVLNLQIKTNLYAREGKSINNFQASLPASQSDLAQSIISEEALDKIILRVN